MERQSSGGWVKGKEGFRVSKSHWPQAPGQCCSGPRVPAEGSEIHHLEYWGPKEQMWVLALLCIGFDLLWSIWQTLCTIVPKQAISIQKNVSNAVYRTFKNTSLFKAAGFHYWYTCASEADAECSKNTVLSQCFGQWRFNNTCCNGASQNHFSRKAALKCSLMDYTRVCSCPHLPSLKMFFIRLNTSFQNKQWRTCQFVLFSISLSQPRS